jgi:type I restriction enzyme S subunit
MARALFKDWFVDFGPVRAKMEGLDPYLPADLWQRFPDRLDDEGKPEGWEVAALGDVAIELRRGISPSYLDSGGVRVLNQKCIRNREINFCLARRHDHSKRKIEGRTVMAGDILVNSTGVGTLGRTAQLWRIDEPTVIDSHVSVVRPNTDIVSICYLGLNLTGREAEIEMLGEGSTGQTELSRARLGCLQVLVPPRQILDQFDAKARPLLDAIFANTEEGTTLAQLRDTLLPKLISGDLRIADAEYFLNKIEDLSA